MAALRIAAFLKEARRRRVFRVAALYIVAAWIALQAAALAFPGLSIPESAIRYVWIGAILGLPVALFFGWRYDFIGGRVIRTEDSDSETDLSLRRADYLILAALAVVVAGITAGIVTEISETQQSETATYANTVIDPKSVAILPFSNISAEEENAEFLAFGVHDDLLTMLSRIEDLKVISRSSVERFSGTDPNLHEIGTTLAVSKVLQGSVQRAGDQIRINVRLTDAATDEHIWVGQYDREISALNIFSIQNEIVTSIMTELRTILKQGERNRLAMVPTQSFAAYEAYQLGKLRSSERTVASISAAIEYFEQAIEIDPKFALAYVELSDSYIRLQDYGDLRWDEVKPKIESALKIALQLDPNLGEAYASLALSKGMRRESVAAEDAFQKALALSPNYARAYHLYGLFLALNGRFEEALEQSDVAISLDPLSAPINMNRGQILGYLGRNDEALSRLHKALEIDPNFVTAYWQLCRIHRSNLGELDQSVFHCRKAAALDPNSAAFASFLAFNYSDLGDSDMALLWANRAATLSPTRPSLQLSVQDKRTEIIKHAQDRLENRSDGNMSAWFLTDYLVDAGRFDDARTILESSNPEWFVDQQPEIYWNNDLDAARIALILQRTGDEEKSTKLFSRILSWQERAQRMGEQGYRFVDVMLYSVQGRTEDALAAFRQAYEEGQRAGYNRIRIGLGPWLDSIKDDPEFKIVAAAIESDLAGQLQRVKEMEDTGQFVEIPESSL